MRDTGIFELALGLASPWKVKESIFDPESKRLDIIFHFARGSTFTCPDCGQTELKAHDTVKKTCQSKLLANLLVSTTPDSGV
jgi:hypothetical protein